MLAVRDEPWRILVIVNLLGTLLALGPAIATWQAPTTSQWILLPTLGILAVTGQALFLRANQIADASFLSPFIFSGLVYAAILGFLLFDEIPTGRTILGAGLIVGSNLYMTRRTTAR